MQTVLSVNPLAFVQLDTERVVTGEMADMTAGHYLLLVISCLHGFTLICSAAQDLFKVTFWHL